MKELEIQDLQLKHYLKNKEQEENTKLYLPQIPCKTPSDYIISDIYNWMCVSNECTVDSLLTDTSIRQTLRVGPCLSLLILFDSLQDGHLSKMDT